MNGRGDGGRVRGAGGAFDQRGGGCTRQRNRHRRKRRPIQIRVGRGVGGLVRFEKVNEKVDFGAVLGWGQRRRRRRAVLRDRGRRCGLAGGREEGVGQGKGDSTRGWW